MIAWPYFRYLSLSFTLHQQTARFEILHSKNKTPSIVVSCYVDDMNEKKMKTISIQWHHHVKTAEARMFFYKQFISEAIQTNCTMYMLEYALVCIPCSNRTTYFQTFWMFPVTSLFGQNNWTHSLENSGKQFKTKQKLKVNHHSRKLFLVSHGHSGNKTNGCLYCEYCSMNSCNMYKHYKHKHITTHP